MRRRLLFLCHRIPYPPDKGEKIRAWHILNHLAERWEVDLGFLADDPADLAHLPALQARCAVVECRPVSRRSQILRALVHLRPGQPLGLGWFHEPHLRAWVERGLEANRYDAAFVYSSTMAPYVMGPAARRPGLRRVLDMVDVDSEKWLAYAANAHGIRRQVWAREARTLLTFERQAARDFDRTLFVSEDERRRFVEIAPECASRAGWVDNGVDLHRFDPARPYPRPFKDDAPALVFTGTMDYRPNVDAVCWFVEEVMPRLLSRVPSPHFHIVGANPSPQVRALAQLPNVHVTGRVADTRPYIAHADAVVAPLRIARGIQNKVLEAMAMARPVIASPQAFEGVRARPGRDLLVADGAAEMARMVAQVLDGAHPRLGEAARASMLDTYDWAATLRPLEAMLGPGSQAAALLQPHAPALAVSGMP
ncbi:TIGR03087 family PEP-CTERM/XrtA system glycosyltransferase [Roseomonas xinghualingensis]|uniref:TIGR03087 family PEP-CTERM/XrtA system glycosyltransferase n=1 Tax=Roseomonas xinghualingensis TaxID=2986475 RepID=UPI0021F1A9D6|nr:TIGR03087 family PEP-CTERM/XrtA system glycosyltransferase [Roseomonas sp. SXEYE001]MCV4208307.1 TIGR03087 family PEP-CTERM/XrtA system glycosyltransferase [Roseomonas sp. SXEYE001]